MCLRGIVSVLLLLALVAVGSSDGEHADLTRATVTRPVLVSGSRSSRRPMSVLLRMDSPLVLELRPHRQLLPAGHTLHAVAANGTRTVYSLQDLGVESCSYQGTVGDAPGSWAAVSACPGIRGAFFDGRHVYYIQADERAEHDAAWGDHYVYRHDDLDATKSQPIRSNRVRRDASTVRGPWDANWQSRYIELALILDRGVYEQIGRSLPAAHRVAADVANVVAAMYAPLNIFIALVGVEVWTEMDRIQLLDDGDATLTKLLAYRKRELLLHIDNDNAQLITAHRFDNGVVGKALKGMMCTYEYSGGLATNHSTVLGLVAATVAHEMGHNLGMEHDSEDECECADERCIMAPSSGTVRPTHWSSCSRDALALAFARGLDYCLRNKPKALADEYVCGNGWVEPGEQCDCGPAPGACAMCCHPGTCTLRSNATCATGACCDLERCTVKPAGTVCRQARQECDLPEHCTGTGEYCPDDVHKMDGVECEGGTAYCAGGQCRTHTDQCKLLWGSSGLQSHERCYEMNKNGSRYGNCGLNRSAMEYARCLPRDVMCGMLHCRHLNERLEFGVESVATISHAFINVNGSIMPCRTALVDLGTQRTDPGLVPDGAKCGKDMMCSKQRCVPASDVRARIAQVPGSVCPSDCSGHGVCNSLGSCHCSDGFAPPLCAGPGPGGSIHSGPATDMGTQRRFVTALYVLFLGIVPAVLLLLLLAYYARRTRPRKMGGSPHTWDVSRRLSRGASKLAASLAPAAPPIQRPPDTEMASSLLHQPRPDEHNFFGHFKGFSLAPIDSSPPPEQHTAPARAAPPPPFAGGTLRRANNAVQNKIRQLLSDNTPAFATANPAPRPDISSPVLEASTCAAAAPPVRPAPPPPAATLAHADVKFKQPGATPSSDALKKSSAAPSADVALKPLPAEPAQQAKKGINLNRITSFLKQENTKSSLVRTHSLPRAPGVRVRDLTISGPVLQQPIEPPRGAVPVQPVIETETEKPVQLANGPLVAALRSSLARAQSMRRPERAERPELHSFGSMRAPRPASAALAAPRPTSPPPPAPQYPVEQYADTRPVTPPHQETHRPPTDNIYAVIEEPSQPVRTSPQPPPVGYTAPRPIPTAAPAAAGDLLGEIVSEIETRNTDSIYSTSTLARRKATAETTGDTTNYANSSAASTTSSGYLAPSAVNVPVRPSPAPPTPPSPSRIPPSRITTPPSPAPPSRIPTPPSLAPSSRMPTPPSQRTTTTFRPPSANSPDVVSSCNASKVSRSPDVVRPPLKKADSTDGVRKPKASAETKPPATGRPTLKPAQKSEPIRSEAKPDVGRPEVKPDVAKIRGRGGAASTGRGRPVTAPRPTAPRVASLQQKFERKPTAK